MSPIDHELHDALRARAATLAPPADPLAGIERRAAALRRRRLLAAGTGGALLIAAVAVAVPLLLPGRSTATLTPADPSPTATTTAQPGNLLLTWPQRGGSTRAPSTDEVAQRFATAMGRPADASQVSYRSLFVGDTGRGEAFTMGQAWFAGDSQAYDVAYTTNVSFMRGPTDANNVFFLGKPTPADPVVLAFQVPNLAGMSDLLVVVPRPGITQVSYSPDLRAASQLITSPAAYGGVVLIDRQVSASNDWLELRDDSRNPDPAYSGPVAPLVCGLKNC